MNNLQSRHYKEERRSKPVAILIRSVYNEVATLSLAITWLLYVISTLGPTLKLSTAKRSPPSTPRQLPGFAR